MVNEYKKIVLLIGLGRISDHDFRMVKSLLSKELKLNKNMQDDYDRVNIADLMEDKFPEDAGLDQLIELYKEMPGLGDLVSELKKEKAKANRKQAVKSKTAVKRHRQGEPSTSQAMSTANEELEAESGRSTNNSQTPRSSLPTVSRRNQVTQMSSIKASSSGPTCSRAPATSRHRVQKPQVSSAASIVRFLSPRESSATASSSAQAPGVSAAIPAKKQRLKTVPREPSEVDGHQQGPKHVMVLKATKPFKYGMREEWMFHATVATETEFFRVKVFDIVLKDNFIPNKIITLSDYVGQNGFIVIRQASSVSKVNDSQSMHIPTSLRQRANATPKIEYLCSKRRGIFVFGVFKVVKKEEMEDRICYEIEDNTGMMEVTVYGRLTSVDCNPGNKLRLVCFELISDEDKVQLRSTRYSDMQVIKAENCETTTQPFFSYETA